LEARSERWRENHPDTLGKVNNLAVLSRDKGDYAGVEPRKTDR
jgi:hypothetical protein